MTFKEYRQDTGYRASFSLLISEGKNLRKAQYTKADFDEDESYELDECEVTGAEVNQGLERHFLKLRRTI